MYAIATHTQDNTVVTKEVLTENEVRHDWNGEASVAWHPE